jgi:uncharacterized membrane protein YraQ (UPF0718 family)
MYNNAIQNFSVIFISIVLEALPFIMIGAFISSLIQVYVTESTIAKILPKNKFLGLLAASLVGIVFPLCECAIIPVARRLMKKGVPVYMAVTFMLAVPIVNPIVMLSTYYAFHTKPYMVLVRGGFGILIAIFIGFIIYVLQGSKSPVKSGYIEEGAACSCGYDHSYTSQKSKFMQILHHTNAEVYDIGKLLILGAFLSGIFQTLVSRQVIAMVGKHPIFSIISMMAFAYVLSLCSEADAFIASTFIGQFTTGSIAAFLLLGPMIDIKNTLMLTASFKKSFVIKLILLIFTACFVAGSFISSIFGI